MVYINKLKKEIKFDSQENLVLKQWFPGKQFQLFNRVDVKDANSERWAEGIVTDVDNKNMVVEIKYFSFKQQKTIKNWFPQSSFRLEKPGAHSSKGGVTYDSKEVNQRLYGKRKQCKMNEKQEQNFKKSMNESQLVIKETERDGNCMFRAISDQIYGDEKFHDIIRDKCMNYIQEEASFFQQFIEGGEDSIGEYIQMKRTLGVWGDDIELQALSEIYNRPIEIYSNSKTPLKTFHENTSNFSRVNTAIEMNRLPIRISYHGKQHYNSIRPLKSNNEFSLFVNSLFSSKPGQYEDEQVINAKVKKDIKNQSRKQFEEINKNRLNLDDFLFDDRQHELNDVLKESELNKNEEDLVNSAIKLSLENNSNENDYLSIPAIQTALEFGFSLDDAILAYSLYSESTDLMLQYLYSMKGNI